MYLAVELTQAKPSPNAHNENYLKKLTLRQNSNIYLISEKQATVFMDALIIISHVIWNSMTRP